MQAMKTSVLAVTLELLAACSKTPSESMAMIMPEESNAIRMLDQAKDKRLGTQRP